ncbi:MAG: hypothetical protein II816_07405, partial [Elusimicrobia bacterium]|nr:hypothetical protein [Elusimicrobiota bacterium]
MSSRSEQTLSVSERERSAVSVNRLHTSIPQDIYTSYCSITDSFFCADSPVTVIIQDLHNDYLVQNNIYKTIDLITKSENFSVYGEGVFGEVLDVSILKDIPDSRIKKYTINNLFKNSTLSAYEYYALVDDKEVKGLENKEVYLKNLKLYNNITENKSFNISLIDEALSKINYIKKHFAEDRIAVIQSLELSKIDFDETQFPNLAKYKSVNQKNSQINKNKLNRQFKNFVKKYGATREVHKLLKLNSRYGYAQLYDYINENLNDVAKNNKELTVFLENNKLFLEINPVKLFYEQQSLKNILLSKENLEQTEKEILLLEKFSLYLKDLANLNILPENYTELKENKSFIRELIKKYLPKNEAAFVLQVINNKDFFTFYDNNFERNKIFANVLMKDVSDKIVITGGFHKGLSEELKKNNKSYIVLTPQFSAGSSAFNDLLLNAVKEGFNEKTADKLLTILYSWRTFFKDIKSFQQEVDHWIENNKILSDNHIKITVSEESISVECNNIVYEKTFIDKGIVKTEIKVTQKQLDETVEDILNIARDVTLFGADVKVKISSDDNLLENIIPAIVRIEKDYPVIYINEKFLEVLSQNLSLTEFFVRFVYLYHSPALNADEMHKFIDDNYDTFRKLYNLKKQIEQNIAYKSRKRIRRKISEYFEKIKLFAGENVNYELPAERLKIDDGKDINDKIKMNHALERVTYTRKTRSFLVSFIQPPIGAYVAFDADITDKDDIETGIQTVTVVGRGINETNSLLHAESFTFVDFFKNYIDKFEKLPNGELTEKGKFLNSLLDLVLVNGQDTKNKIFLKNPIIFNNLGITNIDYSKKRDINTVFAETNAVLQFVNNELGSPLSGVTLYCTLAPCNKCVETMVALGIKKLVFGSYSANKKHKGIKRLEENRIEVEGGVLEQFCDEAIKNYRFMNASLFRTKIASAIQKIRRFLFLSKKYDRKLVKNLIEKVLDFGSYSNINIKELEYLQEHLNWNNLQEDLSLLDRLMAFLKDIDAYDDPVKRAGIMYALKNNCSFDMKDGNIYFYNSSGQKLAFYITPLGKFAASQNYFEKMKQVALARNFTDIDDHLALRGEPFNENIRRVVSILTMYGIANPIPVTGNILKVTRKRIDPLGNQIANLIPSVYIENAAIRCNIKDGEYIYDEDFIKNIAKSYVEKECLEYMREMFSDIGEEWYSLFVFFADKIKV